ncbi:MAG: hypothetical protein AAGH40_02575 [Verrucomicrobiota bacterium]
MKDICRLIFVVFLSGCGAGSPQYYSDKYSSPAQQQQPKLEPDQIITEKQLEGHTCGFHALSSLYRAYGVDPVVANLRFRLGVDKAAIPFDSSTLGSIHPDIYRVASQDGFYLSELDPRKKESVEKLCDHFSLGKYALALIKIRNSGALHWIVLGKCRAEFVMVYDALEEDASKKEIGVFFSDELLSLILVDVSTRRVEGEVWNAHKQGIEEMNRVRKRMSK